ncbi:GNAT family acetyltransferase, partial [Streptococcus suis]
VYTDSEKVSFIDTDEIADVCGKDEQSFVSFIQSVICQLFEEYEKISFDADDCYPISMHLADQFRQTNNPSWDAYILEI